MLDYCSRERGREEEGGGGREGERREVSILVKEMCTVLDWNYEVMEQTKLNKIQGAWHMAATYTIAREKCVEHDLKVSCSLFVHLVQLRDSCIHLTTCTQMS